MKLSDLKSKINWKVLLVLLVIGWFFVIFTSIFGIALVGAGLAGLKNGAESLLSVLTGTSASIPAEYKTVFDAASNPQANANHSAQQNWKIRPEFLAAIFVGEWRSIADSGYKTWPPINGPWGPSGKGAQGPFQFMPATWDGYKQFARPNPQNKNGDPNVQDIWDASFAAADKLAMGGAAGNTTDLNSLRNAASLYNSSCKWEKDPNASLLKCRNNGGKDFVETAPYVNRVIAAFTAFMQISNVQALACTNYDGLNKTYGTPGQTVESQLTNVNFMGKNIQFHKTAATALQSVVNDIKASGTNYQFRRIGGYVDKAITGQSDENKKSMHAYGIAIDINDDTNPYQSNITDFSKMKYDLPQVVIDAFKRNGFRWGGDYRSLKDPMHFEYCR